jgi:hypothetical protein
MSKLRESMSLPMATATLVFGLAVALVVTSCGDQGRNPVAPGAAAGALANSDVPVEPTPTPTPPPDPTPTPTPTPGGGEGCTPGYWKQAQHFDSWTAPYTPGTLFSDVFENAFPGLTLLQVLELNGGGLNALGRHAVAGLLSAASDGVDYDLTGQQVIDAFNAVFPGGDYETLKNRLDFLNNQGCPLD